MSGPTYTSIPSYSREYSQESSMIPIYNREYSREYSLGEALPVVDDDAVLENPMSPIFQYSLSLKQNALEIERRPSRVRTMTSMNPHERPEVQPLAGKSPLRLPKRRAFEICVQNLTYKVKVKEKGHKVKKEKTLLNQVTADARHGEVLGIFGPSGSGKTTLLDALAGRIDRRCLEGTVLVNGKPIDHKFKRISGYVMQDDSLFPLLTVRETLMFSARLRLRESMTHAEKLERVEIVIQQLGLSLCANTRIGSEKIRGISGGERRRVSIGVDVIHDPSVLLLDEPLSGLDSTSALQVMEHLSTIAKQHGRTVLLTVHQPSYLVLELIHNTLMLCEGNVIYHGPHVGMINFYSDMGYNLPEHMTVVEYMLDSVSKILERPKGLHKLVEYYHDTRSQLKDEQIIVQPAADQPSTFATTIFTQTVVLAERSLINIIRTKQLFIARLIMMAVGAFIMGSLFIRCRHNETGVRQRQSFFGFTLAFFHFTSSQALPLILSERQIFIRETDRGAYHTSAYVLSGCLIILPFLFVLATVFTGISYAMVGLEASVSAICFYLLVFFLALTMAHSCVTFIAGLIPDLVPANEFLQAFLSFTFLFSGFFIQRTAIPKYWLWIHYLSPFKYPYEALMYNEFSHLPGVVWFDDVDSQDVLNRLALDHVNPWRNVGVMVVLWGSYNVLFYCALKLTASSIARH